MRLWTNMKYCPGIFLQRLSKNAAKIREDCRPRFVTRTSHIRSRSAAPERRSSVLTSRVLHLIFNLHSGVWSPNCVHSARRPFISLLYLPG
jgi:hypothetical protein